VSIHSLTVGREPDSLRTPRRLVIFGWEMHLRIGISRGVVVEKPLSFIKLAQLRAVLHEKEGGDAGDGELLERDTG
jgi:hypothetical protein